MMAFIQSAYRMSLVNLAATAPPLIFVEAYLFLIAICYPNFSTMCYSAK